MKKMRFLSLTLIAACAMSISCSKGTTTAADDLTALEDSTSATTQEPLKPHEVDYMMGILNIVADCLDSIQIQEQQIFNMPEKTPKNQIVLRLNSLKDLLARKQSQINELAAQDTSANNAALANFQKMIDYVQQQWTEKAEQITKLEDVVQNKDFRISKLSYDLNALTEKADELQDQNDKQERLLNQAFYIMAEKKDLEKLGLLEGGGLTKKRANYANIDQSQFKEIDIRNFKELSIKSKKPKLITEKPEGSYTLTQNSDGTTTLKITNATAFWAASPYLIIQL